VAAVRRPDEDFATRSIGGAARPTLRCMTTRRRFLQAGGVLGAAAALPSVALPRAGAAVTPGIQEEIVITDTIGPLDSLQYRYFPFRVPPGVNRIDAAINKGGLSLGFGVFDERGPDYQSPGFRGVFGGEDAAFFLTADQATRSFLPGEIRPGTWTFVVPVFEAARRAPITIRAVLGYGPQGTPFVFGPEVGVVDDRPGWYRGDLHCHTPQSSDANASGAALSPAAWAQECRRLGLDFAAMTDHNVISQNLSLAADAGQEVLLLPGEEMTNWFHGHATVSGMDVGEWLDWRQRPLRLPLGRYERRITEFIATAREMGAYISAAHPFIPLPGLPWNFFRDSDADPAALPHALEVWTGPFFSAQAVARWESELRRGRGLVINGGSDLHGTENTLGARAGGPTTVVYAERLEKRAVVDALRAGRSFVTRAADGGELYLSATGPDSQVTFTGGTIYGRPGDMVRVSVEVRTGARLAAAGGLRVLLIRDGTVLSETAVADGDVVRAEVPIAAGGWVRAELRARPTTDPGSPLVTRTDMEALTNALFLSTAPLPADLAPEHAPPPAR